MRNFLLILLICCIVFFDNIYNTILSVSGIYDNSGQMKYLCIGIFAIALFLYLPKYVLANLSIRRAHIKLYIWTAIIISLYCLSGLIYSGMPQEYTSSLLRVGSSCFAASLCGLMLSDSDDGADYLTMLLPFFTIALTIIVFVFAFSPFIMIKDSDYGWNYQSISYCMAYCFVLNAYCLITKPTSINNFLAAFRNVMIAVTMFANVYLCLNAGGRGATVLLLLSIVFLCIFSLKRKLISCSRLLILFLIFVGCILIISNYMDLWSSDGFYRVTHMLERNTEEREKSYSDALHFWLSSPIFGYGVGSIWHTVGFYSHNFLTDMLAETGLLGICILGVVLIPAFVRVYLHSKYDSKSLFVIFYFSCDLIMHCFSGYWITSEALWLMLGYSFSISFVKQPELRNTK